MILILFTEIVLPITQYLMVTAVLELLNTRQNICMLIYHKNYPKVRFNLFLIEFNANCFLLCNVR